MVLWNSSTNTFHYLRELSHSSSSVINLYIINVFALVGLVGTNCGVISRSLNNIILQHFDDHITSLQTPSIIFYWQNVRIHLNKPKFSNPITSTFSTHLMRHKAPKSAGLFVFRLAKQKQKQKELKYLGLDVKQQIEPVNHHNVYVSCAWTCADVRKICTAPIKKMWQRCPQYLETIELPGQF